MNNTPPAAAEAGLCETQFRLRVASKKTGTGNALHPRLERDHAAAADLKAGRTIVPISLEYN
jgi:hypothetical protein